MLTYLLLVKNREERYQQWLKGHPELAAKMNEIKVKYKLADLAPIMEAVKKEHPSLSKEADEFQKLVTTADPMPGMANLIEKLTKKGYSIITASNMTQSTYRAMVANKSLPPAFTTDFFFVQVHPYNLKPDKTTYYKKPDREYFENLKRYIADHRPNHYKNYVFTDDKPENVTGAQAAGLTAILFKNTEQFENELQAHGVLIE